MKCRVPAAIAGFCLLFALNTAVGAADTPAPQGYYRYPAIHGDTIAFVAEGDVWTVGINGGVARRLTSHPGEETHPRISPDGRLIAFAASYEGPTEVYTMPLEGGAPTRRTFAAEPSIPVSWTPGGRLLYTTTHYSTLPESQLVELDLASARHHLIPLSQSGEGVSDPEGTLYFVRPPFHRQAVKRYHGGTARKIWRFAPKDAEATNLTADYVGESFAPMWEHGRIYFVTDRDGTLNIWSMKDTGGDLKQHTKHSGWDVQSPDLHQGRIVYQLGADLWLFDIATGVDRVVPITLASDFDQLREKWIERPIEHVTSAHLHPTGQSVVLTARGGVFVAPAKGGRFVRVARKPGVRYRDACFMPTGRQLLALSDETGELEFHLLPARGLSNGKAITHDGKILKWRGQPSPDGKHFAYADKNDDLWITDVANGESKKISKRREGIQDTLQWSPDSRSLVFCENALNAFRQLYLYELETGTTTTLTSDRFNSVSPAWSPDGEWLYFLSDRAMHSIVPGPWGARQPEAYFDKSMEIFRIALRKGIRSPFQPNDELHAAAPTVVRPLRRTVHEGAKEGEESKDGDAAKEAPTHAASPKAIRIDRDGIEQRIKTVPAPRGNFTSLAVNRKALFWLEHESGAGGKTNLMALEIGNEGKKPERILPDVRFFELSANGQKLLVRKENEFYIIDAAAAPPPKLAESHVDLGAWHYSIDVREDLHQMFVDAWRLHRDYFYDRKMHGVNWVAMREKYEPLVKRVTSRSELNDLLAQMVGELSVLHSAVRGGDLRKGPDQIPVPSLGARLDRDENKGGYRIDYIYQSDPDLPDQLSPLADPDLDIHAGDVIEAINGEPVLSQPDPQLLLRQQQGRQVLLHIRPKNAKTSRDVIVTPIADEADLRYRDWTYTRRKLVESRGNGKIGYVHLRAMTAPDLAEWYRSFYPIFDRQGLIIDVRHNRGGNIDSLILEKLMRKAWFYWQARTGVPTWNMQYAFRGHLVVLCDENTASDGEAFTEGFRRLGLGKVIGTRTWGGEIWLSSQNTLSDGGVATAAENGVYGPERKWLIEGHGVEPDIVVDNLPHATFNGADAQLDAAFKHLQEAIAKDPRLVPEPPPYPDKSFRYP
ncbi:MAG TPA: S41 family peptidase [Planctomycetaceae bacterium]|nr:S41 family peptidase [Planctomycetaceae bacterium]